LGGAAVHRCDKCFGWKLGFSRWGNDPAAPFDSNKRYSAVNQSTYIGRRKQMIEAAEVKQQIRDYVVEEFAKSKGINQVSDDEVLTKNGIIDSMGIFRLVAFLEETFNVRIGDEEITHDNLESIDAIEKLVLAKAKK
jgi:acyl carrier protein